MIRVAINGFGRIGRNFMRCWLTRENSQLEVVAVNDTSDPKTNAHLLKYDTMLGVLQADISAGDDTITVNGKTVKCVSDRNPLNLPWDSWGIDLVVESTGVFVTKEGASKHLAAGAKKVLITAPGSRRRPRSARARSRSWMERAERRPPVRRAARKTGRPKRR